MKRRDWRIKKLKKLSYGNFYKRNRIYFLRKLFLRKNLVLIKKNLIMHYVFYKKMFITSKIIKKRCINRLAVCNYHNYSLFLPDFFFYKKVFCKDTGFRRLLSKYDLNFIFINNFSNNLVGNNIIILQNKNFDNFMKSLLEEENKKMVSFKNKKEFYNKVNFNFFFNYNLLLNQNIEIYKILILLHLNLFVK